MVDKSQKHMQQTLAVVFYEVKYTLSDTICR